MTSKSMYNTIQQNSIPLRHPVREVNKLSGWRQLRPSIRRSYTRPASNPIRCGAIFTASTQSGGRPGACWMVGSWDRGLGAPVAAAAADPPAVFSTATDATVSRSTLAVLE